MSLQQVLDGIKEGNIPSRQELGFTFVESGIENQAIVSPVHLKPADRPATFVVPTAPTMTVEPEETEDLVTAEEHDALQLPDWREVRLNTSQLRRRPLAA